jgi:hypothetical protein
MRTNARACPVSGTLVTREITVRSFGAMTPNKPRSSRSGHGGRQRLPHIGLGQAELPGDLQRLDASLEGGANGVQLARRQMNGGRLGPRIVRRVNCTASFPAASPLLGPQVLRLASLRRSMGQRSWAIAPISVAKFSIVTTCRAAQALIQQVPHPPAYPQESAVFAQVHAA